MAWSGAMASLAEKGVDALPHAQACPQAKARALETGVPHAVAEMNRSTPRRVRLRDSHAKCDG